MTRTRIEVTVSPSEIDTFRQCPHKHELAYKERWTKETTAPALLKGTRWHQVMEVHYLTIQFFQQVAGGKWDEAGWTGSIDETELLEQCQEKVLELLDPSNEHDELIWWVYQGHVAQYGADLQWKILGVEHAGLFQLPDAGGRRSRFSMKTKIDLIVRDLRLGGLWIVDHKSGKDLPKDKELDLADQFGLYHWGMRSQGHDVLGTIYNAARMHRNVDQKRHPQPLEARFRRVRMSRTDIELQCIADEAYRTMRTAYGYKPGEAPRAPNPDSCRWRCDYTDACLIARKGVDQHDALRDFGFVQDFTRH